MVAAARVISPCPRSDNPSAGTAGAVISPKRGAASPRSPGSARLLLALQGSLPRHAHALGRRVWAGSGALPASVRQRLSGLRGVNRSAECCLIKKRHFWCFPIKFLFGMQALALPALPCNPFTLSM